MEAVAHLRDGPTSSTWTSNADRLLPSWSSHERCWSLPTTTTREPFWRDSATFSAMSRQQLHRKNPSSLSSHWPSWFL
jgi:hypothetical protein